MAGYRNERDSLGEIQVPANRLWGAQTQRALTHFQISSERMPPQFVAALAEVKRAAATVNAALGSLNEAKARAIIAAADEVIAGQHVDDFPLPVWQTGSGTQTNMNMNEVLANRSSELLGGSRGQGRLVHPNDEVNRSQSSNDIIPTAMHVAAARVVHSTLLPALRGLRRALAEKATAFNDIVKIGRTHLQDATPITLGQEFSGYVAQVDRAVAQIENTLPGLYELAAGGTAVGTGLNAPTEFAQRIAAALAKRTGLPFVSAANKFQAIASHDSMVFAHGALKAAAAALLKIANDLRLLGSGPRCGLGELRLPANEPGSSIMPGKANPTQSEALTMICCQVMGNDVALSIGAASGHLELNAFKPLLIHNFLQSVRLLADGTASFSRYCVEGIEADRARIDELMRRSLMLVTALTPHIGYDRAGEIARKAQTEGTTLKDAAVSLGYVTSDEFDAWVQPQEMVGPQRQAS